MTGLSYTIHLTVEDDGWVIAEVDEMPGCVATADDTPEALRALADVMVAWQVSGREERR